MGRILTQKDTGVFIQLQPGKQPYYLGECIDLDSIPNPRLGGVDPIYCWNSRKDGFVEKGTKLSPPGRIEFTVSELIEQTASWLDKLNCPFTFFALQSTCGERGTFGNWERGSVVANTRVIEDTLNNVAHHVDDNEVMHELSLSGSIPRMDVWPMAAARQTTTEIRALTAVDPCGNLFCGDDCGAQTEPCDNWVASSDGSTASSFTDGKANVWVSADKGVTWTATAADPFAVNENILAIACFEISKGVNRYLVVRGTDPANPLEAAYSDDGGATWTLVEIGSTNGETIVGPKGLFALDSQHLWLVTDQGNVFYSADGGESWTDQGADGVSGGNPLNAINFLDTDIGFAVGDSDTVIKTIDGGAHWTAATATGTGDDLLSLWVFSKYRVLVGTDGTAASTSPLWMSFDGGATWEAKTFTGYLTESVADMFFFNAMRGVIVTNTSAPVGSVHETIDGGHNWRELTIPSNSGLNAIAMCDMNKAMVVGEVNTGTAFIGSLGAY